MPPRPQTNTNQPPRDGRKLAVEKLVERVFIRNTRTFGFSHRALGSLRHPYTNLICDGCASRASNQDKLTYLLKVFLEAKDEKETWMRIERIFDSKLGDELMESFKLNLLRSTELLQRLEVLWSRLGGESGGLITEDSYKQFHQQLYFTVFGIDDMALLPATMQFILEDYQYDSQGKNGIEFGAFASSMLELTDNWTRTRTIADFSAFMDRIIGFYPATTPPPKAKRASDGFTLNQETFFRGGVVVPRVENGVTEYYRTTM